MESNISKKKKYLLFNKNDGRLDSEKPCAFFGTAIGCRSGASCPFLHSVLETKPTQQPQIAAQSTPFANHISVQNEKKDKKKEKQFQNTPSQPTSPVATPSIAINSSKSGDSSGKKRNRRPIEEEDEDLDDTQFLFSAVNTVIMDQSQHSISPQTPILNRFPSNSLSISELPQFTQQSQTLWNPPSTLQQFSIPPAPGLPPPISFSGFSHILENQSLEPTTNGPTRNSTGKSAKFTTAPIHTTNPITSPNTNTNNSSKSSSKNSHPNLKNSLSTPPPPLPPPPSPPTGQIQQPAKKNQTLPTSLSPSKLSSQQTKQKKSPPPAAAPSIQPPPPPPPPAHLQLPVSSSSTPQVPLAPRKFPTVTLPPSSSSDLSAWIRLVQFTQAHPRFARDFTFETDHSWVSAKEHGELATSLPKVIAIDCEMCESTDPVTGLKEGNTLIRFSAVDAMHNNTTLVDMLVVPSLTISDLRSRIHGISDSMLAEAARVGQCTLRHAQARLIQICSPNTILVGHSLSNDLRALRFQHSQVVDTAYLYPVAGDQSLSSPGLREIAAQVLNLEMSDLHDSVQDASASAEAANYIITHGSAPQIIRKASTGNNNNSRDQSLLLHRIPPGCTEQHIYEMITKQTSVVPIEIQVLPSHTDINPNNPNSQLNHQKMAVVFPSQKHAELAFEAIQGPSRPDKQNRDQKRIYLKAGGYICIRRNYADTNTPNPFSISSSNGQTSLEGSED